MEDKRKENPKKTKRMEGFVNGIKEVVEVDRRIPVGKLASMFEVSKSIIHAVLHDDRDQTARWVPKLNQAQLNSRQAQLQDAATPSLQFRLGPRLISFSLPKSRPTWQALEIAEEDIKTSWEGAV